MGEIIFIQKFPALPFFIRRFSRVWPVLFTFVIVILVVSRMTTALGSPMPILSALTALTFTYGYAYWWGAGWLGIGHVWSLCIEEHCYVILLCIAALTARNVNKSSIVIFAITILSICDGLFRSLVLKQNYYGIYVFGTDASVPFVTIPALVYLWRNRLLAYIEHGVEYLSPLLIVVGIVLYYHRIPIYVTATLAPLVLGCAVVTLPYAKHQFISFFEHKILTSMGIWSYSIYIWQQPFMVAGHGQSHLLRSALMIAAILTGIVSYYFIERPARSMINRRFASRARVKPVDAVPEEAQARLSA